jgi:hypothetical protein
MNDFILRLTDPLHQFRLILWKILPRSVRTFTRVTYIICVTLGEILTPEVTKVSKGFKTVIIELFETCMHLNTIEIWRHLIKAINSYFTSA